MKNPSWLYYKGYYEGFQYWNNFKPSDEPTRKQITTFFKGKNDTFTKAVFSEFKIINPPNLKNENSRFQLKTTYPGLLLGIGYTHGIGAIGEFKIGFQLDYVSGLPVVPGSSIKGVIRSAFPLIEKNTDTGLLVFSGEREEDTEMERTKAKWILALLDNINNSEFLNQTIQPKEIIDDNKINYLQKLIAEIFEGIKDVTKEKPEDKYFSIYNRNIFFDAIPVKSEHTKNLLYGDDSVTPHINSFKNPTPLLFLKVLPNVLYQFNFKLHDSSIESNLTKDKLLLLFQKIILDLGIGAKTNVGYGQFSVVNETDQKFDAQKVKKDESIHVPKTLSSIVERITRSQDPIAKLIKAKSEWYGTIIEGKGENVMLVFELDGNKVFLKKKKNKIAGYVEGVSQKVKIIFKTDFLNDTPDFSVTIIAD